MVLGGREGHAFLAVPAEAWDGAVFLGAAFAGDSGQKVRRPEAYPRYASLRLAEHGSCKGAHVYSL